MYIIFIYTYFWGGALTLVWDLFVKSLQLWLFPWEHWKHLRFSYQHYHCTDSKGSENNYMYVLILSWKSTWALILLHYLLTLCLLVCTSTYIKYGFWNEALEISISIEWYYIPPTSYIPPFDMGSHNVSLHFLDGPQS